jgi:hypothetical protein
LNIKKHYLKRTLWVSSILLTTLVTGCNSSNDSSSPEIINPEFTVTATNPTDDDKATSLNRTPLNRKVIAAFSEAVDASTIDKVSFSVKDAGGVALIGEVSVDAPSHTATFAPAGSGFAADTRYTATLTTAIKSTVGSKALANDYVWSFTSGTATDDDAPIVESTNPDDGDIGVLLNRAVSANFSEVLDPSTAKDANFTLSGGGTNVEGFISFGGTVVTFTPNKYLDKSTDYTATLKKGIKDLAGNPLAAYDWSFTTGKEVAEGPKPVNLGTAGDFAILTKTGITNVPASKITGNIGASGITAAAMDTVICSEITGNIYGDDAGLTGPKYDCYIKSGKAATAVLDMGIAYTDAAGRTTPDYTELYAGDISGRTLEPGLYKWGTNVLINKDVTLEGGPNDVWIFQIAGDVIQASGTHVTLTGGALAKNVFWQVGGGAGVSLDTGAHFKGVVLAVKKITVKTDARVNGRLLSQTAVTLQQNDITEPAE